MKLNKKKTVDLDVEITFDVLLDILREKLEDDEDINLDDVSTLKLETVERGLHSPRLLLRKDTERVLRVIWD